MHIAWKILIMAAVILSPYSISIVQYFYEKFEKKEIDRYLAMTQRERIESYRRGQEQGIRTARISRFWAWMIPVILVPGTLVGLSFSVWWGPVHSIPLLILHNVAMVVIFVLATMRAWVKTERK